MVQWRRTRCYPLILPCSRSNDVIRFRLRSCMQLERVQRCRGIGGLFYCVLPSANCRCMGCGLIWRIVVLCGIVRVIVRCAPTLSRPRYGYGGCALILRTNGGGSRWMSLLLRLWWCGVERTLCHLLRRLILIGVILCRKVRSTWFMRRLLMVVDDIMVLLINICEIPMTGLLVLRVVVPATGTVCVTQRETSMQTNVKWTITVRLLRFCILCLVVLCLVVLCLVILCLVFK